MNTNEKVDHLYSVVKGYIGEIEPAGDSNIDEKRTENLFCQINLVEKLLQEIKDVTRFSNSDYGSMSDIGKIAEKALKYFEEYFGSNANVNL